MSEQNNDEGWFDKRSNVTKIMLGLILVGVVLFFADAIYHKHIHFEAERIFGFYALVGFLAFVGIVLAGKALRKVLMRFEDYYDE